MSPPYSVVPNSGLGFLLFVAGWIILYLEIACFGYLVFHPCKENLPKCLMVTLYSLFLAILVAQIFGLYYLLHWMGEEFTVYTSDLNTFLELKSMEKEH